MLQITTDEFIDVLIGTRKYIPCICQSSLAVYEEGHSTPFPYVLSDVYNKIDAISLEQVDKLARQDHTVVISAEQDLK